MAKRLGPFEKKGGFDWVVGCSWEQWSEFLMIGGIGLKWVLGSSFLEVISVVAEHGQAFKLQSMVLL